MGRLGISYLDVEDAAVQLKSKGLNPTVDAVRSVLGTGSKSTIVPYLKRWRSTQTDGVQNAPEYLNQASHPLLGSSKFLALAKELYDHLELAAADEIKILKQRIDELRETLCISEQDRSNLMQQKAELKTELKKLIEHCQN